MENNLSIIVPIDLSRRGDDIYIRSKDLINKISNTKIKLIFGHADYNNEYDLKFKDMIKNSSKNIENSSEKTFNSINLSKLRNLAFQKVKTDYILLLDIDIYFDKELILYMLEETIKNEEFEMAPCFYLKKNISKNLIKNKKINLRKISDDYFNSTDYSKEIMHLAIPSSIMLLKSSDYKKLNGFDESFTGHGYEDFDFMIRLSCLYNRIKDWDKINIDNTYLAPLLAEGFRAELATYTFKYIIQKKFMFHIFHPNAKIGNYYKLREKNKIVFNNKVLDLKTKNKDSRNLNIMEIFQDTCKVYNKDFNEFKILLDENKTKPKGFELFKRRFFKFLRERF